MKTKYTEWVNAETMHQDSLGWLSELRFIKNEELFFDDLVKSYTLQLIDSKHFRESKIIVEQLSSLQKKTDVLIDTVLTHETGLKVMVDGVNEFKEEKAYKDEHGKLITKISAFLENYRILKSQLFALIKSIIKEEKQKRLLQ